MKNRIKELRKDKNMTMEHLAIYIGVRKRTVSRWESEKISPTLENWQALANFFNVSVPYLQGYLIAECRWCGNKFFLTSDKDKDRYFYCPYCGRSPLTFKTK